MKSSKILVLPSSREGFGMVVLEANACGLPVLTVDEPQNAAQHLIREGINGVITEASAESIAKGISELLESKDTLEPERDIARYDWRNITAEIRSVFALNSNS